MAQTVEELAELLDNIKVEAERNAESFDKILNNINNKLDFMAQDTESDDLIKVYLTELKKTLEERHALVVEEFGKIETSFNNLASEQDSLVKNSDMKEMFEIFTSNMQSVAQELFTQRDLLAKYEENLAKYTTDKTDKNDIIDSVSAIRKDVEVINQSFESSISNINSNVQSIFKNLIVMDPSAQNDIVKRELENIYLSTNAILTALHTVEQKSDDIIHHFDKLVTKDNFEQSQNKLDQMSGKLDELVTKNDLGYFVEQSNDIRAQITNLPQKDDINLISQQFENIVRKDDIENISNRTVSISEMIEKLPQQGDFADVYKAVNEFSTVLDVLKNSLTSSNDETSSMIREQLSRLHSVLSSVVTENDFAGFRHDLADFVQKIIDNSASLNDNLNVNKETLQTLITNIEALDIHKNIETVANSLDALSESASNNAEKILGGIGAISEKVNSISTEVAEQKLDNLQEALQDSVTITNTSINALRETSVSNVDKIVGEICNVSAQLSNLPTQSIEEKIDRINEKVLMTSQDLKVLQDDISEKLADDDAEKFQALDNSIEFLREMITSSQVANEASLAEKLLALRDMITSGISTRDERFSILQDKLDEFVLNVDKISADTEVKLSNSLSEIVDMKLEVEKISREFEQWNVSQETRDLKLVGKISSELEEVGVSIATLQDSVQAGVHQELSKNAEAVELQINNLIQMIDSFKAEILEKDEEPEYDYESAFKEVKDKITAVKQEINLVNTDIMDTLTNKTEAILMELAPIRSVLEIFDGINEKLDSKFDEFSSVQVKEIHAVIDEIKQILGQKEEISFDEVTGKISDAAEYMKKAITEKMTSNKEELKNLISVAMNNDDITWAIDSLKSDLSDKVTRIFNERNNYKEILDKTGEISQQITQEVVGGTSKISELLDVLNQKVDVLALADNSEENQEILDEVNDIKNMISSQRSFLEKSATAEKANANMASLRFICSLPFPSLSFIIPHNTP